MRIGANPLKNISVRIIGCNLPVWRRNR